MSKYTEKDAAEDTDASISETREAWHDARQDAQESGELNERADSKDVEPVEHDRDFHQRAVDSAQEVSDAADDSFKEGNSGK